MLKLKRLQILGFKSFCDRTELKFHGDGVAAIIGPNGCGKSNISDAISWVLGEQSAKTLRGARMEDVIFAGTRDRKPTGMAEVSLTLIDPEASWTVDPSMFKSKGRCTPYEGMKLTGRAASIRSTRSPPSATARLRSAPEPRRIPSKPWKMLSREERKKSKFPGQRSTRLRLRSRRTNPFLRFRCIT